VTSLLSGGLNEVYCFAYFDSSSLLGLYVIVLIQLSYRISLIFLRMETIANERYLSGIYITQSVDQTRLIWRRMIG
jgi:hypothetical protein